MDYIYLRAGRVRPWGESGGVQNKFEQKIRGGGQGKLLNFFHNFRLDYFFFKWESKAGRWDDPAN